MSETLTRRTGKALRKALEARAHAQGQTLSETARDILQRSLDDAEPLGRRTGHLRGRLQLAPDAGEPWRAALRKRNWRP